MPGHLSSKDFGLLCLHSKTRGTHNRGDRSQQKKPTKLTICSSGREEGRRGGAWNPFAGKEGRAVLSVVGGGAIGVPGEMEGGFESRRSRSRYQGWRVSFTARGGEAVEREEGRRRWREDERVVAEAEELKNSLAHKTQREEKQRKTVCRNFFFFRKKKKEGKG